LLFLSTIIVSLFFLFSFTDAPTPEIYTLSLHDALPIFLWIINKPYTIGNLLLFFCFNTLTLGRGASNQTNRNNENKKSNQLKHRSEEHTSELQSRENLVCRLLLEKKKKKKK